MSKIDVVPHDPAWQEAFKVEAERIKAAMGENLVAIHHVGSTSIPGIYAKPVIDMLVEVKDVVELDRGSPAMRSLGYEVKGEFGIAGRRYFRKDNAEGIRTHQIHAFETGSEQIARHLAFRDYMIAHPEEAQAYGELKRRLVAKYADSPENYMDGKDEFIKEIDRRATTWRTMGPAARPPR